MLKRALFFLCAIAPSLTAADWKAVSTPTKGTGQTAWLRCYVQVPDNMTVPQEKDLFRDSVTLALRDTASPVAVFLNGQKIIESPAVGREWRRFKVPKGILEKKAFNCILLRVEKGEPLREPPLLSGYFDEVAFREWESTATEPGADEMKSLAAQPERAAYTKFKLATTPLGRNVEAMPGQRQTPETQLAQMKPSDDLRLDLVVAEPLVAQPTHFSFDARGRMWVAQFRQYPYPAGVKQISRDQYYRAIFDRTPPPPPNHDKGRDIISIHSDSDGDGKMDRHETFADGLNMANAVVTGHGGAWVMHPPYLIFYPDADSDDKPDGPPQVRLAGFGLEDTHGMANGLAWGPDGWLYGAQGSTSTCRVTIPGKDKPPVYFEGCFVWRYHTQRREFEIFAEGGGNTFSLEFDAEGRVFSGHNGGDTRGWHFVQNGVFLMQGKDAGKFGPPRNPYVFDELPSIKSTHRVPRFTHSVILAEGSAMPSHYAGRLLGVDPLHRKITLSSRERLGSTFETTDIGSALTAESPVFRPVFITNGADGAVYVADFCEEYIAHGQHYQSQIDAESGRIFRLRGRDARLETDLNLAAKTTGQLVSLLAHPNKWHRHTALRLIGERKDKAALPRLLEILAQETAHPALEALWATHQLGELDTRTTLGALGHKAAILRAWAVRLAGDDGALEPAVFEAVKKLAATETDPEVRSQIASTVRRLPAAEAIALLKTLVMRDEDETDRLLPLQYWHALEDRCDSSSAAVVELLRTAKSSRLLQNTLLPKFLRRCALKGTRADLFAAAMVIPFARLPDVQAATFQTHFEGRTVPPFPEELTKALVANGGHSLVLRVRQGEADAIAESHRIIADENAKLADRVAHIRLAGEVKRNGGAPVLLQALHSGDARLKKAALSALPLYDDPAIPVALGAIYSTLPANLRTTAQITFAARESWVAEFRKLNIPEADIAVEIRGRIGKRIADTGSADAIAKRSAEIRDIIAAAPGDPYAGEATYTARCAACHQLFHKGGRIGPNLTTYQRDDLGTMLTSILSPNAEIREGYTNVSIATTDGRTLGGFIASQDNTAITLRGFDGHDTILPLKDVKETIPAGRSLMPDGLLDGLTDKELRDFFAYLRIPQPISR